MLGKTELQTAYTVEDALLWVVSYCNIYGCTMDEPLHSDMRSPE